MRARRWAAIVFRGLMVVAVALLASLWAAPAALAHFGLEETSPAEGEVVDGPLAEIAFNFNAVGQPVGEGFELVDGAGRAVVADVVSPDGGVTWVVTPAQPLTEGVYGVAWTLAAPDTHPVSGTLTFRVTGAPAPAPPTGEGRDLGLSSEQPSADLTSALARPDDSSAQLVAGVGRWLSYVGTLVAVGALAFAFTALVGTASDVGTVARLVRVAAAAVLLGALVHSAGLTMVLGGSSVWALTPEALWGTLTQTAAGWAILAQAAGALVLVALMVLVPAPIARRARSATHHLTPRASPSTAARVLVSAGVAAADPGHTMPRHRAGASTTARVLVPAGRATADSEPTTPRHRAGVSTDARVLVPAGRATADSEPATPRHRAGASTAARGAVASRATAADFEYTIPLPRVARAAGSLADAGPPGGPLVDDLVDGAAVRVSRGRSRPAVALAATALLLGAFLLDGHTATAGPRAITVASDLLHTLGGAVWIGGVVALAVLVVARTRRGRASGLAAAAVRFSVPAAAAVLVVGIAGTALAATILESPSQLISTTWGVLLLAKVALVVRAGQVG